MLARLLSGILGLIALAALAAAGHLFFSRPAPDGFVCVLPEPDRVLDDVQARGEYELAFELRNATGHAVRVIGSEVG